MRDFIEVVLLLILIKVRWVYFHMCPWYRKFSVNGTDKHFQNIKTNAIHRQIIIEFQEDSWLYKGD